MNIGLWTAQILLALAYLFFGGMKLMMSDADLSQGTFVPPLFSRFIGFCEVLGAFGLVLPGLFHIRTGLTPLAAALLAIVMVGAVVVTIMTMGVAPALLPLILGALDVFVAYGRWYVLPLGEASHEREHELQSVH